MVQRQSRCGRARGAGFEPPPELRIDNFEFDGVKLPYLKFPETPR